MFKNTIDNKRYYTLNCYYKKLYGKKVVKISLNTFPGCPNKINGHGCIFCNGDFTSNIKLDIKTEFNNNNKTIIDRKWHDCLYIAYFQGETNTYKKVAFLKDDIEEVLNINNVIGLTIATRPDCLSDEWIKYLDSLNKKTNLCVELGLQSSNELTLKLINRGHDLETFTKAVEVLHKHHIKVVAHVINGLPNDTYQDMINTAIYLNKIKIDGIKFHMLYVTDNTVLKDMYDRKEFTLLTKEEYIKILANQLTYLNEDIVIHRITGDPKRSQLIAPLWLTKKCQLSNDLDKYMVKHNLYQGINCIKK